MTIDRTMYLGGTDCAPILGVSRWKTLIQVWAEKTGAIKPKDEPTLAMKLGTRLEATVAELFMEETGKKVHRVNETLFHPTYNFIGANIDRRVIGEDAGLEVKTVSAWKYREWEGEEIPPEYELQCHHYMAVTGKKRWYIAALIGNTTFKWKVIERNEKLIDQIIKREVSFWNTYVVPNVMPMIVTKDDAETLYELYPMAEVGTEVELGDAGDKIIEGLEAMKADRNNLEGLIDKQENELKALLKENETGLTPHYVIQWKNVSTTRLDTKKIKTDEPMLYEKYGKETKTRCLKIKKLEMEG